MNGVKLEIPKDVYDKVMYWVKKAEFEVSGFGTVSFKDGTFTVHDAFLLEQEGTSGDTEINPTAMSKAMYECSKRKLPGELKWWWHSHVNMSVFWSGTDTKTIEELGGKGWCVATVFNKREELRSAFCAASQVALLGNLTHMEDEIDTEIKDYYLTDVTNAWDKEYDLNVKRKEFKPTILTEHSNFNRLPMVDQDGRYSMEEQLAWERVESGRTYYDGWVPGEEEMAELVAESKYLGMGVEKYMNILQFGSWQERLELEDKLIKYYRKWIGEDNGTVTPTPNKTNRPHPNR
jgi:hypothetical protein